VRSFCHDELLAFWSVWPCRLSPLDSFVDIAPRRPFDTSHVAVSANLARGELPMRGDAMHGSEPARRGEGVEDDDVALAHRALSASYTIGGCGLNASKVATELWSFFPPWRAIGGRAVKTIARHSVRRIGDKRR
jgi:hypothetical protein